MTKFSTREAAKKLGISHNALAVYARTGKIPAPEAMKHGERVVHIWTEAEIEHVRKLLPKIANGRKTRYKKSSQQSTLSGQQRQNRRNRRRRNKPQHGPRPVHEHRTQP